MRVLIWNCDDTDRDAGKFVYQEAKRQGYDVHLSKGRDPKHHAEFLENLERVNPDWVFSYAVKPFCIDVYNEIKRRGIKLAISYHDQVNGFRVKYFKQMAGCFDLGIFSIKHAEKAYKFCAKKTVFIPQYFDDKFNELKWKRLDPAKKIFDLIILSYYPCPLRRQYLDRLKNKYKIFTSNDCRGTDMTEAYAQSKIALGLPRQGFTGDHGQFITSNRIYNAMGSGAFYLAHYINNVKLLFEPGKHLDMVESDSYKEFEEKIEYWLTHEEEREQIALAGQTEILNKHTLEKRVPEYMKALETFQERT